MRLEDAVGQALCPTLFGAQLRDQPYDAARVLEDLDRYGWGGYILFHGDRDPTAQRVAELQAATRVPLLVAADMEHGAGQQIRGLSVFPTAMAFGAAGDLQAVRELGAWTAREALATGINWVLAPVADVTNNPLNPIINIRSFGGDPERVAGCVEAFVHGCQQEGALACAKHFPGHGDTSTDSHTRLGTVSAGRERLDAVELPPFRAAIRAGVASIMTAHLAVPALGADGVPATLSRAVMTGVLREDLGFDGLIVTDALVMGGITRTQDPVEAAVQALLAGCDMLLMPPDPAATYTGIMRALDDGRLPESRVLDAARRVLAAKARLRATEAPRPTRSAEALAAEISRQSLILAKGQPGLRLPDKTFALAIDDGAEACRLDAWQAALGRHGLRGAVASPTTSEAEWADLIRQAEQADMIVIGVFSPIRVSKARSLLPASLAAPIRRMALYRAAVVISFSSPFLVCQFPEAAAWVLTCGMHPLQIEAAVAALRTGSPLLGRLPVSLPDFMRDAPNETVPPTSGGPAFA